MNAPACGPDQEGWRSRCCCRRSSASPSRRRRAGRGGLRDLTVRFVEIANELDIIRRRDGKAPVWFCIENVPGLLNHPENPFGAFLAGLVGVQSAAQPPEGRWRDAGVVAGPARVAAWRILDSRYFGVAQRRKRVFVLARGGPDRWACPEALLPITNGMCGDPEKGKESAQKIAGNAERSAATGGEAKSKYFAPKYNGLTDIAPSLIARRSLCCRNRARTRGRGIWWRKLLRPGGYNASAHGQRQASDQLLLVVSHPKATGCETVRRLLPVERQRLQGFRDDFLDGVLYRGKPLADRPRYR